MPSFKQRAISGTIWTIIAYGSSQVLRFVANLILTRLLVPEMFGLMALVNVFLLGLELFSDLGLNASIIQNPRGNDPNFLNTAWTLQILRGLGLWIVCLLLAWPIAQLYHDSRLLQLIPVVGLSTVIQGLNSTYLATLNRNIEIVKLIRLELSIQILSLTIMIVWAYLHPSVWALVAGATIANFVKMLWSHRLNSETPNRLAWELESLKDLISFGKWIFISTALTFLAAQSDRLILGKLLSFEILGVYTIALTLAEIPKQVLGQINMRVIFPMISHEIRLPRTQFREKFLRQRWWMLLSAALLITLLFSYGDFLISHLYDQRYQNAVWIMPILALGFWPFLLAQTSNIPLLALGKPHYTAFGNFLKVLFIAIGLPLSFFKLGFVGAIILIACNDFPLYGGVIYGLYQEKLSFLQQDLKATLLLIILLSLAILIRGMLGLGLPLSG